MDYTAGGFNNVPPAEFVPRNTLSFVQTTRAHGLALYVAFESPFTSLSDSPDVYAASPQGFEFIRSVPTTWMKPASLAGRLEIILPLPGARGGAGKLAC